MGTLTASHDKCISASLADYVFPDFLRRNMVVLGAGGTGRMDGLPGDNHDFRAAWTYALLPHCRFRQVHLMAARRALKLKNIIHRLGSMTSGDNRARSTGVFLSGHSSVSHEWLVVFSGLRNP